MTIAYYFSDKTPEMWSTVHAFKNFEDLKDFTKMHNSDNGTQKIWEIEGEIDSDDGFDDSIQIRINKAHEVMGIF